MSSSAVQPVELMKTSNSSGDSRQRQDHALARIIRETVSRRTEKMCVPPGNRKVSDPNRTCTISCWVNLFGAQRRKSCLRTVGRTVISATAVMVS